MRNTKKARQTDIPLYVLWKDTNAEKFCKFTCDLLKHIKKYYKIRISNPSWIVHITHKAKLRKEKQDHIIKGSKSEYQSL